jgi:hypothetical protein
MEGVDPRFTSGGALADMRVLLEHAWADRGRALTEFQREALVTFERKLDAADSEVEGRMIDGFICAHDNSALTGRSAWAGIVPVSTVNHLELIRIDQEGVTGLRDNFAELAGFNFETLSWQQ